MSDSAAIIGNGAVWLALIVASSMAASRGRDSLGFIVALVCIGCAATAAALLIL